MLLLALSMFLQAAAVAQNAIVRTFEDDKIGAAPAGFVMAVGRDAAPDGWTVRREGSGRVLVHEGKSSPADSFAVAILRGEIPGCAGLGPLQDNWRRHEWRVWCGNTRIP